MIAKICGKLVSVTSGNALVELNGLSYEIMIASFVEKRLHATEKIGQEVIFHTMYYLEGNVGVGNLIPRLVGFLNETDLDYFSMLITVQGLGVKRALRSLVIPVKEMARAIELNDIVTLKKLPEIGTKTAQKIVVELKGKVAKFALLLEDELPVSDVKEDIEAEYQLEAIEILKQLQYDELEAKQIVNNTVEACPDITTAEELIQEIFNRQIS
ncbi:Holliday junction branch migration protein RuvA [Candidatus Latescibacterota bacterium]